MDLGFERNSGEMKLYQICDEGGTMWLFYCEEGDLANLAIENDIVIEDVNELGRGAYSMEVGLE